MRAKKKTLKISTDRHGEWATINTYIHTLLLFFSYIQFYSVID